MKIFMTLVFFALTSVHAAEFSGPLKAYKPASASSHIHNRIRGEVAENFYKHMNQVPEREDLVQKIRVKKTSSLECVDFYGDENPFYECYFHLNEAGELKSGYTPSFE
jgi:hypothetical protein